MGLRNVFVNGVETVFSVLYDAVKEGIYVDKHDDGFDNISEELYPVRIILDKFSQEDVDFTSFYELVQPTDTKGMVPSVDLPIKPATTNLIKVETRTFTVVAFETDPMEVMYTFLLRDTK